MDMMEMRKLDEEIAEHVMGQIVVRERVNPLDLPVGFVLSQESYEYAMIDLKGQKPNRDLMQKMVHAHIPYYTKKMQYAWMVWERMTEMGYEYEIKSENGQHRVCFWKGERGADTVKSSLSLAIGKAAVAAVKQSTK
jgi:hypothetical protein